jgi:hypothetical protein
MAARLMRRFFQVTQKGKRPKPCSHILTRRAPLTTNLRLAKLARGINARVRANNSPQTLARSSRRRSVVGELGSWVDGAAALFARCGENLVEFVAETSQTKLQTPSWEAMLYWEL